MGHNAVHRLSAYKRARTSSLVSNLGLKNRTPQCFVSFFPDGNRKLRAGLFTTQQKLQPPGGTEPYTKGQTASARGAMWPTLGQLAHASSARKPKNAETFPSALVNHEHARCLSPQSGALLRACRSKAGIAAPETRFFSLRKNTSTLPHPKSRISWTYVNRIYKKDRQVHFVQNKLS